MLRKTLTILSLIGLLLSVGLWGVSGFYTMSYIPKSLSCVLQMSRGTVSLTLPDEPFVGPDYQDLNRIKPKPGLLIRLHGISQDYRTYAVAGVSKIRNEFGFRRVSLPYLGRAHAKELIGVPCWLAGMPLWAPALLFALSLYFCHPLYYYRRHKRKKLGLCVQCGYDLRGSTKRCPECNTPIECT